MKSTSVRLIILLQRASSLRGFNDKIKILPCQARKEYWEAVEPEDGNAWSNKLKNTCNSELSQTKGQAGEPGQGNV